MLSTYGAGCMLCLSELLSPRVACPPTCQPDPIHSLFGMTLISGPQIRDVSTNPPHIVKEHSVCHRGAWIAGAWLPVAWPPGSQGPIAGEI